MKMSVSANAFSTLFLFYNLGGGTPITRHTANVGALNSEVNERKGRRRKRQRGLYGGFLEQEMWAVYEGLKQELGGQLLSLVPCRERREGSKLTTIKHSVGNLA